MTVFYTNGFDGLSGYSNRFVTPRTLALNAGPNQQFRVDLLAPLPPLTRWRMTDIRATVFETQPGTSDAAIAGADSLDLSRWAGQTLRLRIATADNQGPMRAGVDNIRLIPLER